ncbi:MAG: carboxymuconolactone decarboxylase family protein [Deltaproteobacteria bacterium]|nr:carboxymuconolactone decarboxylase family protein [Deltaproteobacteria bacterium]
MRNRDQIYTEMTKMFGTVPSFFKLVPDNLLENEWELFKAIQVNETKIPGKYRDLIGLGIAAATHCPYCATFHTEMARVNGATDAEIEEATHYAKQTTGWSTYLHGMRVDLEQFRREVQQVAEHVRKNR